MNHCFRIYQHGNLNLKFKNLSEKKVNSSYIRTYGYYYYLLTLHRRESPLIAKTKSCLLRVTNTRLLELEIEPMLNISLVKIDCRKIIYFEVRKLNEYIYNSVYNQNNIPNLIFCVYTDIPRFQMYYNSLHIYSLLVFCLAPQN